MIFQKVDYYSSANSLQYFLDKQMMEEKFEISVGFGDKRGKCSKKLLTTDNHKLLKRSYASNNSSLPNISFHKNTNIVLHTYESIGGHKRDEKLLRELLKGDDSMKLDTVIGNCKSYNTILDEEIANLKALGGIKDQELEKKESEEERQIQQMKNMTKCTNYDATRYLQRYKNVDRAAQTYNKHQQIIDKVAREQNIPRQNAKNFLEANDYNENLF